MKESRVKWVVMLLFILAILNHLSAIRGHVYEMRLKMDEVLTNAAECGDIDCDDGFDYARSDA